MTNTCPLCKLRFRCITRMNLANPASPARTIRIKEDRDQRLNTTGEDEEFARDLEDDSFLDDSGVSYEEDSSTWLGEDYEDRFCEDSFIDDADLSPGDVSFSLGDYLQRADTRNLRSLPASSNRTGNERQQLASTRTTRSQANSSRERNTSNWQNSGNQQSNQSLFSRERRQPLNCPGTRRSQRLSGYQITRSTGALTVSGWMNTATNRNSERREMSTAHQSTLSLSSDEDSDDASDCSIKLSSTRMRKSRNATVLQISSDEAESDNTKMSVDEYDDNEDDVEEECRSPSVVSRTQNSIISESDVGQEIDDEMLIEAPNSPSVVSSSHSSADVDDNSSKSKRQSGSRSINRCISVKIDIDSSISERKNRENSAASYLRPLPSCSNLTNRRRSKRNILRPNYRDKYNESSASSELSDKYSRIAKQDSSSMPFYDSDSSSDSPVCWFSMHENGTVKRGKPLRGNAKEFYGSCSSTSDVEFNTMGGMEKANPKFKVEKTKSVSDTNKLPENIVKKAHDKTMSNEKENVAHSGVSTAGKSTKYRFRRVENTCRETSVNNGIDIDGVEKTTRSTAKDISTVKDIASTPSTRLFSAFSSDDNDEMDVKSGSNNKGSILNSADVLAATPQEKPRFRSLCRSMNAKKSKAALYSAF